MTTWQTLCRLQPALRQLERDALAAHDPSGPPDWQAWEALKQRLSRLVGWWAIHPHDAQLSTNDAWKTAYTHLFFCFEIGHGPDRQPKRPPGGLPSLGELERLSQPMLPLT